MGGKGSGRLNRTDELLNKFKKVPEANTKVTGEFIIPNHSGDHGNCHADNIKIKGDTGGKEFTIKLQGPVNLSEDNQFDFPETYASSDGKYLRCLYDAGPPKKARAYWYAPGENPVGTIIMYGGSVGAGAPAGYFFCDGSLKDEASYAQLFDVIGYSFGGGVGLGFAVPNFNLKFPYGASGAVVPGGTGGSSSYTPAGTLAGTSGAGSSHTHTVGTTAVTPTTHTSQGGHTHDSHTTTATKFGSSSGSPVTGPTTHSNQGAHTHDSHGLTWGPANESAHTHGIGSYAFTGTLDGSHLPPYLAVNFLIKY
jgi:microcystin-dependent protein